LGHSLIALTAPATINLAVGYSYNADGWLTGASDYSGGNGVGFTYNNLGQATTIAEGVNGLDPEIYLQQTFDADGNRTQLALQNQFVEGIDDFVNNYSYDALNRLTRISQQSVAYYDFEDAPTLAYKTVNFTYNADNQFSTISRYDSATPATSSLIATSAYGYDSAGQISSLVYYNGSTTYASYGMTYGAANQLATFTNGTQPDQNATYTYDAAGQLLATDYADPSYDESYSYDANGNRVTAQDLSGSYSYTLVNAGTSMPGNNEIASDGTYDYQYDPDGNLIRQTSISDGSYTIYGYDFRNRLTLVTQYNGENELLNKITYGYDAFNRLVSRAVENPQSGDWPLEIYIYDGNQMVQSYGGDWSNPNGVLEPYDLQARYLWVPGVDMILAEDDNNGIYPGPPGYYEGDPTVSTVWKITDQNNSVQDTLSRDTNPYSSTYGQIFQGSYAQLDSFGQDNNGGDDFETFMYTGRLHDLDTGLQWNGQRWYNPNLGRFMSQDPIGFNGDPTNPYRYVGNSPTNFVDPSGLGPIPGGQRPSWTNPNTGQSFPVPPAGMGVFTPYNPPPYTSDDAWNDNPGDEYLLDTSITILIVVAPTLWLIDENPTLWPRSAPPVPELPTPPPTWFNNPPPGGSWGLGA
jgi:RHS repeat-associated protein